LKLIALHVMPDSLILVHYWSRGQNNSRNQDVAYLEVNEKYWLTFFKNVHLRVKNTYKLWK